MKQPKDLVTIGPGHVSFARTSLYKTNFCHRHWTGVSCFVPWGSLPRHGLDRRYRPLQEAVRRVRQLLGQGHQIGPGIDAKKEIAEQIRERKADYALAVKQNQPTLYEQVEEAISEALEQDARDVDEHQTIEKGHGRRETRTYAIFPAPESVDPEDLWRDLSAVGIAISERLDSKGRHSMETRYYILSRLVTVQEFTSSPRSLGHREQSPLAVGREFPRGRMPRVPRSRTGQPECDSAFRPGPAETRHQLPKGNRDQAHQVLWQRRVS